MPQFYDHEADSDAADAAASDAVESARLVDEPTGSLDLTRSDAEIGTLDLDQQEIELERSFAPEVMPGEPAPTQPSLDTESGAVAAATTTVEPPPTRSSKKLRARKSRRVIRHIDPWSVLTFSILFHLAFFSAMLLAGVLVWNAAIAAGTVENIENFIRELADYETFEIDSQQVFRAAVIIAGMLTLASSVLVVLLTVVFNLISDLVGGIRITVIEEETVRVPADQK